MELTVRNLHEAHVLLSSNSSRASGTSGDGDVNGEVHVDVGGAGNEVASAESDVGEATGDLAVGADVALVTRDICSVLVICVQVHVDGQER